MNPMESALNGLSRQNWKITVLPEKLPIFESSFLVVARHPNSLDVKVDLTLAESEKQTIKTVLVLMGHNKYRTAKRLGISKATLYRKMRDYGIDFRRSVKALIT